jgi:predicted DNA-binding antitoxin AbrB/MazE fold protein
MSVIHAIYEGGIFRPIEHVALPERCKVEFDPKVLQDESGADDDMAGIWAILSERYSSGETDVAARHNEHQPWIRFLSWS